MAAAAMSAEDILASMGPGKSKDIYNKAWNDFIMFVSDSANKSQGEDPEPEAEGLLEFDTTLGCKSAM